MMRAIELFAGAGGASLGIVAAGFEEVRAIEWNHDACETRRAAGLRCDEGDVRDAAHYEGVGNVDLLWSSFPCQAWSTAGKRLGKDDPRNGWPWTVDALDRVRPRWFIGENVPGLTHHRGGCNGRCVGDCARLYFEQTILLDLAERFAWVGWSILDAARFGVPQNRERLFIVAGPRPIDWPRETHAPPEELRALGLFGDGRKPWRTVREALNLGGSIVRESGLGAEREPRSVDEPAYTMRVQHNGGGCGVSVIEDPKHPHARSDLPAPTLRSGGAGHSSPPMWLREERGAGMSERHGARPDVTIDNPSPVIRAGSGGSGSRVSLVVGIEPWTTWRDRCLPLGFGWYDYAMAAGHPEDALHSDGVTRRVVSPVPMPEWANGGAPKPTRAASRPELLDQPAPVVCAMPGGKGCGQWSASADTRERWEQGTGIRRLTPAECAILQDYPADHPWRGTKTSIYAQIGNSVCRTMARVLCDAIARAPR